MKTKLQKYLTLNILPNHYHYKLSSKDKLNSIEVLNYEDLNKKFTKNGTTYILQKVTLHFYKGWYYSGLFKKESQNSHISMIIKNLNSHDPIILDILKKSNLTLK